MREIKFRAWDGEKMSHSKVEYFDDMVGLRFEHFDIDCEKPTLMQYTGFKDKNGKEIYEGDILSGDFYFGGTGWFDTVEGYYKLENEVVEFEDGSFRAGGSYLSYVGYDIKIVGNIYENPELLEVKE